MKRLTLLILICLLCLPVLSPARTFARWHTSMGSFTAQLYNELMPITAGNFKSLASSNFYNNLIFHRIIEGFVIQDGCPNGTGTGGPGYTIPDEYHPDLNHNRAGMLAMAKSSQPNSAGSQYYFTLAPQPGLNNRYSVFGQVIEGLEYVLAIGSVPTDANDRPLIPVDIYQVRMLDLEIGELYPPLSEPINQYVGQIQFFMVEAYTNDAALSFAWDIDGVPQPETSFIFEHVFYEAGNYTVNCEIASSDSISYTASWDITVNPLSNIDATTPALTQLQSSPNPFTNALDIRYQIEKSANYGLEIYNLKGQKVAKLFSGSKGAGDYSQSWDGRDLQGKKCPAGAYILSLKGEKNRFVKKILKQ
ncbi:MAG: peptidylprolyl isomerase [Candidatus Cloacimonadaceae bacterium]